MPLQDRWFLSHGSALKKETVFCCETLGVQIGCPELPHNPTLVPEQVKLALRGPPQVLSVVGRLWAPYFSTWIAPERPMSFPPQCSFG